MHTPRKGTGSAYRGGVHRCAWTPPMAYVWPRVSHPSWAFALLPISPPTIIFAYVLFHIPVLPFPPALPLISVLPVLSSTSFPKLSWACQIEIPPQAYFLSHSSTISSHILTFPSAFPYPVLPFIPLLAIFVPHFSSQNPLEHACSRSLLHRTYFSFPLPFSPVLPCSVDFTLTFFYCECNAFFLTFCFPGIFEEFVCKWLLFCLFLKFIASAMTVCIFVIVSIDSSHVSFIRNLGRRP